MSTVDGNINICSLGPYRAVHSGQGPVNTILCTRDSFTNRTLASTVYITLYLGGGGTGVSDFELSLA
jgi:hypothetical protein